MFKGRIFLLLIFSLLFSFYTAVEAATFTVTKTADTADGACNADCSLREAIIAANLAAGADTITLPAGVYTLTRAGGNENSASTGDLDITSGPLTINGAGAATTIIQAGTTTSSGIDRVFDIRFTLTMNLAGVTVRNGNSSGFTDGGGIFVGSSATLNLTNSVVAANSTSYYGGGIYSTGTLNITSSTISGNRATSGGGVYITSSGGSSTIKNSTLYGNTGFIGTGAISNATKPLTILNSTIYANFADTVGAGVPGTAGISRISGTVLIRNSIVSKNYSAANPNSDCSGVMTVENSLGCGGTVITGEDTVIANNGGATPTVALFSGSNAIDAGNNATCEITDQRALARPYDGDSSGTATCDIGAFEAHNTLTPLITLNSVTLTEGNSGTTLLTFTLNRFGDTSGVSSVQYTTANGTAAGGSDFVAIAPTLLTFNANETVKTIDVTVNGDIAPEAHETFTLNLSSPTNAMIRDPQGTGTLTNDDNAMVVSKTDDTHDGTCDADCSLREAISAANTAPNVQTISVPSGVYTLTIAGINEDFNATGDLDIRDNLIITGAGPDTTIIQAGTTDANGIDRVMFSSVSLTLSGVTIRHGRALSPSDTGGGIYALNSLTLTNSIVTANRSTFSGGGIRAGTLTMTNVVVSNNFSTQFGGISAGTTTITTSTITGNTATNNAGGMSISGTLNLSNSTVSNNTSLNTHGGGLYSSGSNSVIIGSTFAGNTAGANGGAIYTTNILTVKNSTLSGNSASLGGGIYIQGNALTLNNVTLYGNTASNSGGGLYRQSASASVVVRNSIFAASTGGDCAGSAVNTIQNTFGCGLTAATGINPLLSNNGGLTLTHALEIGSNAIDGANIATCETTDQRGVARPINGDGVGTSECDAGAFEAAYQPPAMLTLNTPAAMTEGDAGTTILTFTVTRTGNLALNSTATYATADVSAVAGSDYVATSGIITFLPTVDTATVDVTINGDVDDESDETFTLTLSAPSPGTTITTAQAAGTITDDDDPLVAGVMLSLNEVSTGEGALAAGYTVYLSSQPAPGETVTIAPIFDSAQLLVTPSSVALDATNWNTGLAFTVSAVDDASVEVTPLALTINHTVSSSDGGSPYNTVATPTVNVALSDNDTAGINVSLISGTTDENGGTASFTITLSSQPAADVTIPLTSSNPAEGSVAVSVTVLAAQWNTGVAVTVTGVNDDYADGSISYSIVTGIASSADANYNGTDPADVAVVNGDNDAAGITITPTAGLVTDELATTAAFTVVLTSKPLAEVIIPLSATDTTEGTVGTSITFSPDGWNIPQTVIVTGVDDGDDDGDVGYTIVVGSPSSSDTIYSLIDPADVSVTNIDND